ncbi:unnamed protein product, partial [Mesorhabditis belari]|uniref:Secreted protein n=1 Tax=Mesorhabditis belari TaxID=2138241 RepID=A0AAF3FRW6_9BILA
MWKYSLILALFSGESLGFFSQGALSLFNGPPTGFNQPQNGDDFTLYNNLQGFDGPPTLYLPFGYFGISRYFTGMDQRNDGNNGNQQPQSFIGQIGFGNVSDGRIF